MLNELPKYLTDSIFSKSLDSMERGASIRKASVIWSSTIGMAILIAFYFVEGFSAGFFIALMIAAMSNCIVWGIYSVGASIILQCDTITHLIIHYSENGTKN